MDGKDALHSDYEIADVYLGLRDQMLLRVPDTMDSHPSKVVVVLLEMGYPEAVVTLVAVADGTASLYVSHGGGIIGSGEHDPVKKAATALVSFSQRFVSRSTLTDTFPLPAKGNVRCYLVSGGGVHTFEAPEADLMQGLHPCSALFSKGHELITAIRETTPR